MSRAGKFIFQLDNLIQPGLDGIHSTVVYATFYSSSQIYPPAKKADTIIPLSTFSNVTGNDASVPPGFSYFNAANDFFPALPPGITLGQGPFREIRLLIDSQVAGVAFPYPVIFTGGLIPSLWRPITAYGAIELPTYFVDITPFIPLLADGKSHLFTIDVVSAENDHTILHNWLLQIELHQTSTGGSLALHNDIPTVVDTFSYPLNIDFTFLSTDQTNWTASLNHSYNRVLLPNPLRLGTTISEEQITDGFFQLATGGNFGNGTSSNKFNYVDTAANTYNRHVDAHLNALTLDHEGGTLASPVNVETGFPDQPEAQLSMFVGARLPGGRRKEGF
ncbi:peptide N-acetyl-beta-D-glucosaminyl asparaginase amidase A-domain-containing protein [Collybia nuda]|uniref:Peptide N-acetyl-beta-D-glucosaminyl asparaginase amidase A-domain-containing protein n=1 Tax=Collybia nuda TaxID=64659 RepID=A0A9P6CG03_9AGAR|nr:peptide N-acetyl-beta-D-glucosaminyl asparaginase amidase A-domain-containing protein [Collybia nuda]